MENRHTSIAIGFREQRIVLRSALPEIVHPIREAFHWMRARSQSPGRGEVYVRLTDGKYVVESSDHLYEEFDSAPGAVKCARFEVIRLLIQAHPEFVWLHAAAVACGEDALLLAGPWGSGKSTVASNLCLQGWRYYSDDIVPLDPRTNSVLPFPLTPYVRQSSHRGQTVSDPSTLSKARARLSSDMVARSPASIGVVVYPTYRQAGGLAVSSVPSSQSARRLIESSFGRSNLQMTVSSLCKLSASVPAIQLCYGEGKAAAEYLAEDANRRVHRREERTESRIGV